MKLLSLLATLVLATPAFAANCPDLKGTYTCETEQGPQQITLDQYDQDGVTYYVINGEAIPADGQVYTLPDEANFVNQSMTFSCTEDAMTFLIGYKADYQENGQILGNLDSTEHLSAGADGALDVLSEGVFTPADGSAPQEWEEATSCPRSQQ